MLPVTRPNALATLRAGAARLHRAAALVAGLSLFAGGCAAQPLSPAPAPTPAAESRAARTPANATDGPAPAPVTVSSGTPLRRTPAAGAQPTPALRMFVVERDRGALALLAGERKQAEITGLGDLSHATVKFHGGLAYLVTRDGWMVKLDPLTGDVLKRARVGRSSIAFTFTPDRLVVANYDPKDVVLLDRDLNILDRMETGSRNVGLKARGDRAVFSLMDADEIRVVEVGDRLTTVRRYANAGAMPFDALLDGATYVVGFYKEPGLGVLDLDAGRFRKQPLRRSGSEVVLKVPHFGLWGVFGRVAYIPAVGERRLEVLNLDTMELGAGIALPGEPVFAAVSPDGQTLAVNFSGDHEDSLSIVDRSTGRVTRTLQPGRRVMHLRFTPDGRELYVSSYYDNRVRVFSTTSWTVQREYAVPSPSGLFPVPADNETKKP